MKRILLIFTLMATIMTNVQAQQKQTVSHPKTLVVYFSRPGNNYVSGSIVNLKIGNTQVIAEKIQQNTDADIFRIVPEIEYPLDYHECTEVAQKEKSSNARPKYKGNVANFDNYDVIYLGYPNWWGTMPMVVCTFLETHNFEGKTIHPFCTHEGSGMGNSESHIQKLCPNATVTKGLAITGSTVNNASADKAVANWIK